tara:strand:+ start:4411 stop:5703 length:1293 start_codon:yes stop_codon:yes gene_type:complete
LIQEQASSQLKMMTLDQSGNVYLSGAFSKPITFGSIVKQPANSRDGFIASLSPTGSWRWAQTIGGGSSIVNSVKSAGNKLYAAGYFNGSVTLGSQSFTKQPGQIFYSLMNPSNGAFLNSFASSGYTKSIGDIGTFGTSAMYLSYLVSGSGISTIGTKSVTSTKNVNQLGGARFSVGGTNPTTDWAQLTTDLTSNMTAGPVAVDANGHLYILGTFSGTVKFGSTTLTANSQLGFIAKMNGTTGAWMWAKKMGGASRNYFGGLVSDQAGHLYISGACAKPCTFGSITANPPGQSGIFLAKVDTNGTFKWVTTGGSGTSSRGYGVTVDAQGNPYIAGHFYLTARFGPISLVTSGSSYIFFAKVDKNTGNWLWAEKAGASRSDAGLLLEFDNGGNLYVAGYTSKGSTPSQFGHLQVTPQAGTNTQTFIWKISTP